MLRLALFEPEIPPNTGNIMRLCANAGVELHLVEPLGFDLEEKKLRRAGLDYRDLAQVHRHADFAAMMAALGQPRLMAMTTKGSQSLFEARFEQGDLILLGPETRGLPSSILDSLPTAQKLRIPMLPDSRSMNLSNAAAVTLYEGLRQLGLPGLG